MIYTSNIQAPSLSSNCIFHAFITLTTITISEYSPNDRVTYNVKLVQAPEMIPLLIPILTIYQISRSRSDVRNCAHEKQKKKEKKKGKEPWYTHNPANITLSILFDRCRKTGRGPLFVHGKERVHQRETGCYPFSSFFHQSANNSAHVRPEIRLSPWETASNQDEWPSSTYTLFQPPSFHSIPGQAIGLRYADQKIK